MANNLLVSQQIAFLQKSSYKHFPWLVKKAKPFKTLFVHLLVTVFSKWEDIWSEECCDGSQDTRILLQQLHAFRGTRPMEGVEYASGSDEFHWD